VVGTGGVDGVNGAVVCGVAAVVTIEEGNPDVAIATCRARICMVSPPAALAPLPVLVLVLVLSALLRALTKLLSVLLPVMLLLNMLPGCVGGAAGTIVGIL
jgi:hypothetical protein